MASCPTGRTEWDVKAVGLSFTQLRKRTTRLGISEADWSKLDGLYKIKSLTLFRRYATQVSKVLLVAALVFISCITFIYYVQWPISRLTLYGFLKIFIRFIPQTDDRTNCFLPMDFITSNIIRPPLYCDFCKNVTSVDRVKNITADQFLEKYAYTSRPLLIEGYQKVLTEDGRPFDFNFIKNLYASNSPSIKGTHEICEYQPKMGLDDYPTLGHLLNMTDEKLHAHKNTNWESLWYVGWINCDREVTKKMAETFLPNFLPRNSEPSRVFWTFIGSPGLGFTMHIDPTFHPQWHTQIYGTKKWKLEPPSECYFECPNAYIDVTMKPGDTLVFHNGMWYHQTINVGDDLSIGVAAEYD